MGLGGQVVDFIRDFARLLELKANEPTEDLKQKTRMIHDPVEGMWRLSALFGTERRMKVLRQTLRAYCSLPGQKRLF